MKVFGYFVLLVVGSCLVIFLLCNRPHQDIRTAPTDVEVSATDLLQAYQMDETAANAKFLGKVMDVSGVVAEKDTTADGQVRVRLEGGDGMFGVLCELDRLATHERLDFSVGEEVVFCGICTGFLLDVVLVRCVER